MTDSLKLRWVIIATAVWLPYCASSQQVSDPDRPYRNNQPHGKWTIWSDSLKTRVESVGRYRDGKERGTWKYYGPNGRLLKKERYGKDRILTRYYHENGRLKSKGPARLVLEAEYLHYFVDGKWFEYDERGRKQATVWFRKGEEIRREGR